MGTHTPPPALLCASSWLAKIRIHWWPQLLPQCLAEKREETLLDVCVHPLDAHSELGQGEDGGTRLSVTSDSATQSARQSEEKPLKAEEVQESFMKVIK